MSKLRNILAYVVSRAHEISSIISVSGAGAVIAGWYTGQITDQQAVIGLVAAVIGYLMPQDKTTVDAVAAALRSKTPFIAACVVSGMVAAAITACSSTSVNQGLATAAQNAAIIAQGLTGALPAVGAAAGMTPDQVSKITATVTDIQKISTQLATAASTSEAQPLVQQLEADINAIIASTAGIPGMPQSVQLDIAAASALLPVIEVAINMAQPPSPVATTAPAAPSAPVAAAALTPDQAVAILQKSSNGGR